jgi:hypothetical protein
MIQIHPLKTRLPPAALGAALRLEIVTSYCCAAPNRLPFQPTWQAARLSAPLHISMRTWPVPAPLRSYHSWPDFLRPALVTCRQTYPATDRCQHNSPAKISLRPAERNPLAPATCECFPAQRCRRRAGGGYAPRLANPAVRQWCGSTSCFRHSQATPKRPSTRRLLRCPPRI